MTIDELIELVQKAKWFERVGEWNIVDQLDIDILCDLKPWGEGENAIDAKIAAIVDKMDWLPTSRDQTDPIHDNLLEKRAQALGVQNEYNRISLEVYKVTLRAFRNVEKCSKLKAGPNDFTEAAKGGALFAARRAVYEILVGTPGFWCRVLTFYHDGHWPCGIMPDGRVVVY